MDFGTLGFRHDLLTSTMHHAAVLIVLSTCITMHPEHSSGIIRPHINMYNISNLAPLPLCLIEKRAAYMKPPVLIISKLASLRDLERGMFCLNKEMPPLSQDFKANMQLSLSSTGRQHSVWERKSEGATPLCKQLTLVAVEGWVLGAVPMSPWHAALRQGVWRAGQTEEAALGPEQNLRTPSVAFSTQQRRGRRGEPETGGPTPHQLAPQPASAHSQGNFPFSSSSQIRQLAASPSTFHASFRCLCSVEQHNEECLSFCTLLRYCDQRFSCIVPLLLLLLPSSVYSSTVQY